MYIVPNSIILSQTAIYGLPIKHIKVSHDSTIVAMKADNQYFNLQSIKGILTVISSDLHTLIHPNVSC